MAPSVWEQEPKSWLYVCIFVCVCVGGRVRVEPFHFVFTFKQCTNGLWNPLAAGGL